MRVLALVTEAFGGLGGIAQYNRDLLTGLSRSNRVASVSVLPRFGQAENGEPPDKVIQFRPQKSKVSYVAAACRTALSKGPFDIIFCGHMNTAPLAIPLGLLLKAPVWMQAHGIDAFDKPAAHIRTAAERAAMITAVSRHTRRRLLTWANIDPFRVRVLPNTVGGRLTPGEAVSTHLERFGLPQGKIILTVSRIDKLEGYKGHANVIHAMPSVLSQHADAIYAIAGDGDGRQELEHLVSRLGLHAHVRFLGRVEGDELLALYRASRVFIMPSHGEGFGIVFLEAAATGLPVIGGNLDGSIDALADGEIGLPIDPFSQDEIVSALTGALDGKIPANPSKTQRFAFTHFADHVDELLQDISR